MSGLEADTIGGYNSLIRKQQDETAETFVSTVLFDDRTEVLHDRVSINQIKPMTEKEYYVRGCTALLDAVGGTIHHIGNVPIINMMKNLHMIIMSICAKEITVA